MSDFAQVLATVPAVLPKLGKREMRALAELLLSAKPPSWKPDIAAKLIVHGLAWRMATSSAYGWVAFTPLGRQRVTEAAEQQP